jgi:subtilisin-like proprotein convertase family protein
MKKGLLVAVFVLAGCGRLEEGASTASAVEPPDFEQDAIALAIPDQGGPQAEFPMALESTGLVGGLSLSLKVTHTYIGDLMVYLEDPTGARVTLHNREGGGMQNIDKIYGSGGAAINQDAVMLHEVHGTWKIILDDEAAEDTGSLQYVKLTILKV